eukprot:m.228416 g.228416  ORF g.228416 m.228416 type:complete len:60 (-) comp25975_c1_seq6:3329-3508(-)
MSFEKYPKMEEGGAGAVAPTTVTGKWLVTGVCPHVMSMLRLTSAMNSTNVHPTLLLEQI